MSRRQITIQNNINELEKLAVFMQETAEKWNLSSELLFNLNLVIEEVVSNIILYGYDEDQKNKIIRMELILEEGELQIRITDSAKAFDPLGIPLPDDLDKPAGDRKIGGLGIFFIRKLMDDVIYERSGNNNILTLYKKIT